MINNFFRLFINIILSITCTIDVFGEELVPKTGGCIIASNHLGRLDPLFVYKILNRNDIIMAVAEKYQKIAFFRIAVKALGAIWIDRFNVDFSALRQILKRLKEGGIMVIAPEGTRSPTKALIEGKPGAAYLAAKSNLPIYPVAITGTEDKNVIGNLKRFRKTYVTIRVGKPFTLAPITSSAQKEILKDYSDEIMCQIAALLPPIYQGVYSNHPRLNEISAKAGKF
jgi:1-acyl-sn-glycerol-3-phosphate acyltransferase